MCSSDLRFLDHAVDEGFVRARHRPLVQADASLEGLLERLATCPIEPLRIDPPPRP